MEDKCISTNIKWYSTKDKLPTKSENVWVMGPGRFVSNMDYSAKHQAFNVNDEMSEEEVVAMRCWPEFWGCLDSDSDMTINEYVALEYNKAYGTARVDPLFSEGDLVEFVVKDDNDIYKEMGGMIGDGLRHAYGTIMSVYEHGIFFDDSSVYYNVEDVKTRTFYKYLREDMLTPVDESKMEEIKDEN